MAKWGESPDNDQTILAVCPHCTVYHCASHYWGNELQNNHTTIISLANHLAHVFNHRKLIERNESRAHVSTEPQFLNISSKIPFN